MPPGGLRAKLAADGVGLRTLVDQIRVQLGWTQVLRQMLGGKATDHRRRYRRAAAADSRSSRQAGIPRRRDLHPGRRSRQRGRCAALRRDGDHRSCAPARRSRSWRRSSARARRRCKAAISAGCSRTSSTPQVAQIVAEMPVGRDQQPGHGAGRALHRAPAWPSGEIGRDPATMLSMRQVFLPFTSPLDPQRPTTSSGQALDKAKSISATRAQLRSDGGRWRKTPIAAPGRSRAMCGWKASAHRRSATCSTSLPLQTSQQAAGAPGRHRGDDRLLARAEEHGADVAQGNQASRLLSAAGRSAVAPVAARPAQPARIDMRGSGDRRDPQAPTLPPLREVIARHGLDARRALGQHFLLDGNLTARIARAAGRSCGPACDRGRPGPRRPDPRAARQRRRRVSR